MRHVSVSHGIQAETYEDVSNGVWHFGLSARPLVSHRRWENFWLRAQRLPTDGAIGLESCTHSTPDLDRGRITRDAVKEGLPALRSTCAYSRR